MLRNLSDTIFALATPSGRGAIAVFRISGSKAGSITQAIAGDLPTARRASLRALRDCRGELLDRAIVLWIPGPATHTGEDCAELHVHGGRAVVSAVADVLANSGARPAEPGEFSQRAFLAGKIGLLEAEAVMDLVSAETSAQRSQALRQFDGHLTVRMEDWSARLRRCLALTEAAIDFPEETATDVLVADVTVELDRLTAEWMFALADANGGERIRSGLVFAIVGPPNVGKSSLLNALAQEDVAIVAATAGTTRDLVQARAGFGGQDVMLVDTAGQRETTDAVELEGIRRSRRLEGSADAVIVVSAPGAMAAQDGENVIRVFNKVDLASAPPHMIGVSVTRGDGLDLLKQRIEDRTRELTRVVGIAPLTRSRHRASLVEAVARVRQAGAVTRPEIQAEELRLALNAIGRITGHVDADAILGDVFSAFCIGK